MKNKQSQMEEQIKNYKNIDQYRFDFNVRGKNQTLNKKEREKIPIKSTQHSAIKIQKTI